MLLAGALFVTGAVVGMLGNEAWHAMRGGPFGKMERMGPAGFILEHMTRELGLSEDQRGKIKPIIDEMVAKVDEARKPFREKEDAIFTEYHARMKAFFTPEQSRLQDELLKRLREHRGKMGPPPGPTGMFGPPPGPPPQ